MLFKAEQGKLTRYDDDHEGNKWLEKAEEGWQRARQKLIRQTKEASQRARQHKSEVHEPQKGRRRK